MVPTISSQRARLCHGFRRTVSETSVVPSGKCSSDDDTAPGCLTILSSYTSSAATAARARTHRPESSPDPHIFDDGSRVASSPLPSFRFLSSWSVSNDDPIPA